MHTNGFRHMPLIVALFFLSGCCGLIYENIWARQLSLYLGNSAFSIGIVLAVFMAGLALGSAYAGKLTRRLKKRNSLLTLYGLVEIGVGLYGLLVPALLSCVKPVYVFLYGKFFMHYMLYSVLGSAVSAVLLIVPIFLMGITLPLLAASCIENLPDLGSRLGLLYGINTIGAAIGALSCGIVMVRWLGVTATTTTAACTNIGIGIIVLFLFFDGSELKQVFAGTPKTDNHVPAIPVMSGGVMLILFLSGMCSMSYEIIWTKLLALLIGPTTYSFAVVLFTFILGLALGSIFFGWLSDRTANPYRLLIVTQLAAAGSALAASQLLGHSQFFFAKLFFEFHASFWTMEMLKLGCLFMFMVVPTMCLGAVIPIASRVNVTTTDDVGNFTGIAYAVNTWGAVIGSLGTAFFLIPSIGKGPSISLMAGAQTISAGIICFLSGRVPWRKHRLLVPSAIAIAVLCAFFPRWNSLALTQGQYHRFSVLHDELHNVSLLNALFRGPVSISGDLLNLDVLFLKDGIGGFVAVNRTIDSLNQTDLCLSISGKTDASTRNDLATMTLLGQVPMIFQKAPKNVFVVGLASGITAGEVLHYPVEQVDIAEISPEVVEACSLFSSFNNNVLTDSRTRVIIQDARTHLALTRQRYDAIISEPSNPWMAGMASLFTADIFVNIRDHLNEGGMFVQWLHGYQMDWESFAMIGRTLTKVFPNGFVIKSSTVSSDYLIVCFKDLNNGLSYETASSNMTYASKSRNTRIRSPAVLAPLVICENIAQVFGSGLLNSEDHPFLEYMAPLQLFSEGCDFMEKTASLRKTGDDTGRQLATFGNVDRRLDLAEFMASMNVTPFGLVEPDEPTATEQQMTRYHRILEGFCEKNLASSYGMIPSAKEKAFCLDVHEREIRRTIRALASQVPTQKIRLGSAFRDLANVFVAHGKIGEAEKYLQQALSLVPSSRRMQSDLASCYEAGGKYKEAVEQLGALMLVNPNSAPLLTRIGMNCLKMGEEDAALQYFERAMKTDARYYAAYIGAGTIYGNRGDYDQLISLTGKALALNPDNMQAIQNMTLAYWYKQDKTNALFWAGEGLKRQPQNQSLKQIVEWAGRAER